MPRRQSSRRPSRRPPGGVSVRPTTDGHAWMLVHPRCARDRADDIVEVRAMIEADELDIAIDELRWLVSGCSEFIEAHQLMGALALAADGDVPLARGHFGWAYQLGLTALRRAKTPSPLPYSHPANRAFFEAGRGLVWCLVKLDKPHLADEVIDDLMRLDPADPLQLRAMQDELASGGLPIVELLPDFGRPDDRTTE